MLSCDKRLPLDAWNTSGLQENVSGNQFSTFDSPRDHPLGIHSCATQRERWTVPQATGTFVTRDDKQNSGAIPMPTFARSPSTIEFYNTGGGSGDFVVGQQRQQISELQFDKIHNPQSFLVWKIRWRNQVTTCSDFQSEALLWMKDVEMVDSLQELKILAIRIWKEFSKIWDAGR